jgi:hypothetical protein
MANMKLLQETTQWSDNTQNHIYIFDNSDTKIAGYIKMGTNKAIKFSKPMAFSKRGRTFKVVNKKNFDLTCFGE